MTHIIYDYLIHTIYDVHTIYLFPCWLVFIAPKTWGLVSTAEKIFELDYAFDVPWIVETREKPRMVSSCWIIFQGLIKNAELFIVTSFFTSFFLILFETMALPVYRSYYECFLMDTEETASGSLIFEEVWQDAVQKSLSGRRFWKKWEKQQSDL